ncbi:MAG TPA: hypothetical protein VK978_05155 [Candidatus Saccharimonadales bacterium]|nr:hypothetical protein [Candidatus Saccharimonadales bacterium]
MVECLAFQELPAFAEALGASQEQAVQAQEAYVPTYHRMPEEYRTIDCHDGGSFDRDTQAAGVFPYPLA